MDRTKKPYFWLRQNSFTCELARIDNHLRKVESDRKNASPSKPKPKATIIFGLKNRVGGLVHALKIFQKNGISVTYIDSRKSRREDTEFEIFVDLEADSSQAEHLKNVLSQLKENISGILLIDVSSLPSSPMPPAKRNVKMNNETVFNYELENGVGTTFKSGDALSWFPKNYADLDFAFKKVLMAGSDLDADHPGFKDEEYRKRRNYFAEVAFAYKTGQQVPFIEYTESEKRTWKAIYKELRPLYQKYACKEYLENLKIMEKECGYSENDIPQIRNVNEFLMKRTGFQLRPVAGYLTPRDFLSALAFRLFPTTQYIRHPSDPFYTPEPDCCHELLGHAPMLADKVFAQFSQEIGLAALGAGDEDIDKLATLYFFTIEFGLCKEDGLKKIYGAGLLSCVSEMKHALSSEANVRDFAIDDVCEQECLVTTFQNVYFVSNKFQEVKEELQKFSENIQRSYSVTYDPYTHQVELMDTTTKMRSKLDEIKQQIANLSSVVMKQ